jgi:ABC-type branched-subunit amino acid transport system permease subunit
MYWAGSGNLTVMVILGGMGSLFGTIVFLVLEEFLSQVRNIGG